MDSGRDARVNYGLDAPKVVRNLALASVFMLAAWTTTALHLWSGEFRFTVLGLDIVLELKGSFLGIGLICGVLAIWMIWESKVGKLRHCEQLLDRISWSGSEQVLDVGCGRGLLLIGAARRLSTGSAVGIDIWQAEDLSGNFAEATLANIRSEGVEGRATVQTADMQKLPFADNSFDVVVSRAAIHNLYKPEERSRALAEITRVVKVGGRILIDDIRHMDEYAAALRAGRCEVELSGSRLASWLVYKLTWGSLRPGVLVATKLARPGP